mgnify:CR=1 FL=1
MRALAWKRALACIILLGAADACVEHVVVAAPFLFVIVIAFAIPPAVRRALREYADAEANDGDAGATAEPMTPPWVPLLHEFLVASTDDSVAAASVAVAQAKALSTSASLLAGSKLFELAGTASTLAGQGLDRFWRNARTRVLETARRSQGRAGSADNAHNTRITHHAHHAHHAARTEPFSQHARRATHHARHTPHVMSRLLPLHAEVHQLRRCAGYQKLCAPVSSLSVYATTRIGSSLSALISNGAPQ